MLIKYGSTKSGGAFFMRDLVEWIVRKHHDRRTHLDCQTSWYLDCSEMHGDIAPDTRFFVETLHDDPQMLINSLSVRKQPTPVRKYAEYDYMTQLRDRALIMEQDYITWRKANPHTAKFASLQVLLNIHVLVDAFVDDCALGLVNDGIEHLNDRSLAYLGYRYNGRFGFTIAVLRRALRRAHHDLQALSVDQRYQMAMAFQRSTPSTRMIPQPPRIIKQERSALKRSITFLSSLIGPESTRAFIQFQDFRIEGRLCVYSIGRYGSLKSGGSTLTLLTKDTGEEISTVCVHTTGVPVLDHVASLIMHIQAGAEEEVLRIGNLRRISRPALARVPDVLPFVPESFDPLLDDEPDLVVPDNLRRGRPFPTIVNLRAKTAILKAELQAHVEGLLELGMTGLASAAGRVLQITR